MPRPTENEEPKGIRIPKIAVFFLFLFTACFFVLSFLAGLYVGRGESPIRFDIDRLEKQIGELRAKLAQEKKALIEEKATKLAEKNNLDFYENLKNAYDQEKETIQTEPEQPEPVLHPKVLPPEEIEEPTPEASVEEGTLPVEHPQADTPPVTQPSTLPAPLAPAQGGPSFTLQISALNIEKDAKDLMEKHKRNGLPAYMTTIEGKNGITVYRVRIGHYSYEEALKVKESLKLYHSDALIVKE